MHRSSLKIILLLSALAVGLLGCDSLDSSNTGFDPSTLQGTWKTACIAVSSNAPGVVGSTQATVVFSGNTVSSTEIVYGDSACAGASFAEQTAYSFTIGEVMSGSIRSIDLQVLLDELTPYDIASANYLSANSICGLTNWSSGTTQSIAGLTCNGALDPPVNSLAYGAIQVSGNTLEISTFVSDSSQRPTAVNDLAYTKQ